MSPRTLVTGFLAFGKVRENPSALLAQSLGRRFELLEVAFAAVDDFVDRAAAQADAFDCLLMLGVRQRGTTIDLERRAHNDIGPLPDVRGEVRGPRPIDPAGPAELRSTLFEDQLSVTFSDRAGCYLCNYLYYRALQRLAGKRVGFIHVPPLEVMPLEAQRARILRVLNAIESQADKELPRSRESAL